MSKKIGWQKYEDYIEKQLSCPILQNIIHNMIPEAEEDILGEEDDDDEDESYEDEDSKKDMMSAALHKMLPLTPLTAMLIRGW